MFSDEKTFQLCSNDRVWVDKPQNTLYEEKYVDTTERRRFTINAGA